MQSRRDSPGFESYLFRQFSRSVSPHEQVERLSVSGTDSSGVEVSQVVVALVVGAAVGFAVRGALTWPALPTPTVLTSAENRPTAAPPTRLRYILQVHYEPGILIVRNDDPNHWTHVVATVGEGDIFFKCLVADTVAPLDHLPIVIGDCRSANGIRAHAAGTSTVVAEQGTIVSAIEPDVPAR